SPDLPPRSLMTLDFAIVGSLVRPGRPRYPVLVHRAAALLHASFRPHLTVTPLRFADPSPPSGWVEDSHLQAVDHARHTSKNPGLLAGALLCACPRNKLPIQPARFASSSRTNRAPVASSRIMAAALWKSFTA